MDLQAHEALRTGANCGSLFSYLFFSWSKTKPFAHPSLHNCLLFFAPVFVPFSSFSFFVDFLFSYLPFSSSSTFSSTSSSSLCGRYDERCEGVGRGTHAQAAADARAATLSATSSGGHGGDLGVGGGFAVRKASRAGLDLSSKLRLLSRQPGVVEVPFSSTSAAKTGGHSGSGSGGPGKGGGVGSDGNYTDDDAVAWEFCGGGGGAASDPKAALRRGLLDLLGPHADKNGKDVVRRLPVSRLRLLSTAGGSGGASGGASGKGRFGGGSGLTDPTLAAALPGAHANAVFRAVFGPRAARSGKASSSAASTASASGGGMGGLSGFEDDGAAALCTQVRSVKG